MADNTTPTDLPAFDNGTMHGNRGMMKPGVFGTVSAISGNIITVTNTRVPRKNGSTITTIAPVTTIYTVDATNAKITQGPNTILVSNIVVGDNIVAQGTVNGNTVVASTIIDQKAQVLTTTSTGTTVSERKGFFGSIGSFFAHLFGY